jgi:hypothetical protein
MAPGAEIPQVSHGLQVSLFLRDGDADKLQRRLKSLEVTEQVLETRRRVRGILRRWIAGRGADGDDDDDVPAVLLLRRGGLGVRRAEFVEYRPDTGHFVVG